MFDVNSKFNTFYRDYVVLSRDEQSKLNEKKRLNIERLESGLSEYNQEKRTAYKIVDTIVQGSMAMHTITQRDNNQYDIDVAIIFDKGNIPSDTNKVKQMVADALKRKMQTFNVTPKVKTNAITIEYAEGYHVDFAIYRRIPDNNGDYTYEHCGATWSPRDPRSITGWFTRENGDNGNLRKVVRLLKMFCKSRSSWLMPGGLVLSVLASECLSADIRLDVTFYRTICAIRDRLNQFKDVHNPVERSISLLLNSDDRKELTNLYTQLTKHIEKLDVLFATNCSEKIAMNAWNGFFQHSYWSTLVENADDSFVQVSSEQTETSPLMYVGIIALLGVLAVKIINTLLNNRRE